MARGPFRTVVDSAASSLDLWQTLRRLESLRPEWPRLGRATHPAQEIVRIAQTADLSFQPSPVVAVEVLATGPAADAVAANASGWDVSAADAAAAAADPAAAEPATAVPTRVRVVQRVFGFLGPNGALPLHLTEYARQREMHHADATLTRFLDRLLHRPVLHIYRAWSQAQPAVQQDRPGQDGFQPLLGSLIGQGLASTREAPDPGTRSTLGMAGRLLGHARSAEGLAAWLSLAFAVPIRVFEFTAAWLHIDAADRTRLFHARQVVGQRGSVLGQGATLGARVRDVQHCVTLAVGPVGLADYHGLLPDQPAFATVGGIVRRFVGLEFDWVLRLQLRRDAVPALQLGRGAARLGWTAWLPRRDWCHDPDDLTLHARRDY